MVLTTPDNITRHDKDKREAWITPAVATNEADTRVHQATKKRTRQNEDDTNRNVWNTPSNTKGYKLLVLLREDDDVLVGHVAEDSSSQPRLDEEITKTMALLKADDET